jgi:membrane-associated phospholipid phosphatase
LNVAAKSAAWAPARHREMLLLATFFAGVVLITDLLNVRLGVELLTLSVAVAGVAISRMPIQFLRDWWFYVAGLVMWNLSGPIAADSPFPVHLQFLLHADRALFLGHDPVILVRDAFHAGSKVGPLEFFAAGVYNLHLPEPFIAAYFLWRLNRPVYFQFAAAVLVLLVLGMATFILFPAVPPWMASQPLVHFNGKYLLPWIAVSDGYPGGLHAAWANSHVFLSGVSNGFGLVLHAHPLPFHGAPLFYIFKLKGDAVAAFPSEHAAMPALEYLAFRVAAPRVSRILVMWVVLVLFSIVFLGEHWVVDALAGFFYGLAAWTIVRGVVRIKARRLLV